MNLTNKIIEKVGADKLPHFLISAYIMLADLLKEYKFDINQIKKI